MIKHLLFLLAVIILSACDPIQSLTIRADKPGTSVSVYTSETIFNDIIYGHGQDEVDHYEATAKKIVITIPNGDRKDTTIRYGIGIWKAGGELTGPNDEDYTYMSTFASIIDSIVFTTPKGTKVLKRNNDITKYLLSKVPTGWGKDNLVIEPE